MKFLTTTSLFVLSLLVLFGCVGDIPTVIEAKLPTSHVILTTDNTVNLRLPFTDDTIAEVIANLAKLDSTLPNNYPIFLTLTTPGGSISAGLDLYTFINGMNRPVHTLTFFAASMGFQTVQQLGERHIVANGILMSHESAGQISGSFSHGESQMDARYALWLEIVKELDKKTVERTNGKQTLESYQEAYSHELWLTGKQSVEQGYADFLSTVSCHPSMEGKTEKVSIRTIFGKMTFTIPLCPLDKRVLSYDVEVSTKDGVLNLNDLLKVNPALKICTQLEIEARTTNNATLLNIPCIKTSSATFDVIDRTIKETLELLVGNVQDHSLLKNRNVK